MHRVRTFVRGLLRERVLTAIAARAAASRVHAIDADADGLASTRTAAHKLITLGCHNDTSRIGFIGLPGRRTCHDDELGRWRGLVLLAARPRDWKSDRPSLLGLVRRHVHLSDDSRLHVRISPRRGRLE